jgi:hypothetical protein
MHRSKWDRYSITSSARARSVGGRIGPSAFWGASLLAGSSADFGKLIADETEKWGKVIKFADIKPE